jgi:hypothetical protein
MALTATETKAQTFIEQIRTAHRAFEAARQILSGLNLSLSKGFLP